MENIKIQLEKFKEELPINSLDLGGECVRQVDLYQRIGSFVMDLKHEARVKKNHMEFVMARIKQDIRNNPGNYGIAKITGDAVEEACRINPDVVIVVEDFSEAQHIADVAMILKEAVEQRKSLIRDAVSLYTHEYYMNDKDMLKDERKALEAVTEDQVRLHRQQLAITRKEVVQEEINGED